jgi:hypothetical protein
MMQPFIALLPVKAHVYHFMAQRGKYGVVMTAPGRRYLNNMLKIFPSIV